MLGRVDDTQEYDPEEAGEVHSRPETVALLPAKVPVLWSARQNLKVTIEWSRNKLCETFGLQS